MNRTTGPAGEKPVLTQAKLKEYFDYDPETGVFTKIKKPRRVTKRASSGGYLRIQIVKTTYAAHRLAWLYMTGEMPDGQIDHIDQDKLNNRFSNLRLATESQNSCNRRGKGAIAAKGVTRHKRDRKYAARIKVNGKEICVGRFDSVDEAAHAYNKAAILYHGEFAVLNPIGQDKVAQEAAEQKGGEA
jgi:hypothetical protein